MSTVGERDRPGAAHDAEGAAAVALARRSIEEALGGTAVRAVVPLPASFDEPRGVFVTLLTHPSGELRGCIGFPRAIYPLREGIALAAVAAATEDPRFAPLRSAQLPQVRVEVSLLSAPERLEADSPERLVEAVHVGRDGLILEGRGGSGLLLPQVAPEMGWDARAFLEGICEKAGLPPGAWKLPSSRLFRFEARVYAETAPRGPVTQRRD